ncbi:MAG: polyhydroxyalkanoate synthesis repressor PhaR [Pseudomonadota bacterium]|nr:polyhydroxyalkanoate synthesis repressor PhaR [Betaproteobacteria bacterium]
MPRTKDANNQPTTDSVDSVRLIKKYPNRRLYDTKTSSYITLQEVKDIVVKGEMLKVVDAKTDEDLTRSIYLQIILEAEAGGLPLFSEIALANMIRFYGHSMQSLMGSYLENNIQNFCNFQKHMSEQVNPISPDAWTQMMTSPSQAVQNLMGNYAQQSSQILVQMQEQMAKAMGLKK